MAAVMYSSSTRPVEEDRSAAASTAGRFRDMPPSDVARARPRIRSLSRRPRCVESPRDFTTSMPRTTPILFGQQFQRNETFQLWGLHAWVWEENPSGIFANWNPRVTCAHTDDVSRMSH